MPRLEPDKIQLRLPQVRVLRCLYQTKGGDGSFGWMSKARIADKLKNSSTLIGKTIGYSDPVLRAAFEETKDGGGTPGNPCPSLLTLGLVEEYVGDLDGIKEVIYRLTSLGEKAVLEVGTAEPLTKEKK